MFTEELPPEFHDHFRISNKQITAMLDFMETATIKANTPQVSCLLFSALESTRLGTQHIGNVLCHVPEAFECLGIKL